MVILGSAVCLAHLEHPVLQEYQEPLDQVDSVDIAGQVELQDQVAHQASVDIAVYPE